MLYVILAGIGLAVFNLAGLAAIALKITGLLALKKVTDFSTDLSSDRIKKFNFPVFSRDKIFSEKRLITVLEKKRVEIEDQLAVAIKNKFKSAY